MLMDWRKNRSSSTIETRKAFALELQLFPHKFLNMLWRRDANAVTCANGGSGAMPAQGKPWFIPGRNFVGKGKDCRWAISVR
jgi:hypothetical protein